MILVIAQYNYVSLVYILVCNECTKLIIQSDIKEVFYFSDKKQNDVGVRAIVKGWLKKLESDSGLKLQK